MVLEGPGWLVTMPHYAVLRQVVQGPLPLTFRAAEDIESIEVLKDAEWIKASIALCPGAGQEAIVTEITPVGQWAFRHWLEE